MISTAISQDNQFEFLTHVPIHLVRVIITATAVLLKVLHSSLSLFVDFESGKVLFNTALFTIRRLSLQRHDQASKTANMLLQLFRFYESVPGSGDEEPRLRVRSRFGASIVYDLILNVRNYCYQEKDAAGVQVTRSLASGTGSMPRLREGLQHSMPFNVFGIEVADPTPHSAMETWNHFSTGDWLWDVEFPV